MKKFKGIWTASLVLSLGLVLAGCGNSAKTGAEISAGGNTEVSTEASTEEGADKGAESTEGTVSLGSLKFGITPGTIRTAVVLLADHLGYYEEEGLDFSFVEIQDATAALTSISTNKGEVDIWGTGIVPGLNFIANGSDLVIFEGTAAEGGAIIALPENVETYKEIGNYEGITVATVRADTAWVVSRGYLIKQGIDVDSIKVIEVDSQINVAEAVKKGEADLGFLPAEFANKYADSVEVVYEVGELEPLYVCCRQVTSRNTLQDKKEELIAFTRANIRALEYYREEANRDEIVSFLASYSNQTEEFVRQYLFENRTIMTLDPNKQGVIDYYNSLVGGGYFTGDIDVAEHVDTNIYEEALQQLTEKNPDNTFYTSLKGN